MRPCGVVRSGSGKAVTAAGQRRKPRRRTTSGSKPETEAASVSECDPVRTGRPAVQCTVYQHWVQPAMRTEASTVLGAVWEQFEASTALLASESAI